MTDEKVIAEAEALNSGEAYATDLMAGAHTLLADEPEEVGGANKGAAPGDYLCMALASCKAITLRMYARRKQWPVGDIRVGVKLVKGDAATGVPNTFYCTVKVSGELSDAQHKRLLEIASVCPIDRLLGKPSEVITSGE